MLTNRTVPVCILATAGWLTTSFPSEQATRWDSTYPSHGNSASTSSPYITNFKKNPHWGINLGVSWGYRSFNIDGNYALLKESGTSIFTAGNEDTSYNKSRLRHFFFRVPVLMEWQQRVGRNKVFFNAGPEFEIRHSVKSFSHINGGKKKTVGKGMYVQPVGINLLAQAGYGNIGIYLRYSTYGLFQKDKGPEVSPYSFGVAWYL